MKKWLKIIGKALPLIGVLAMILMLSGCMGGGVGGCSCYPTNADGSIDIVQFIKNNWWLILIVILVVMWKMKKKDG